MLVKTAKRRVRPRKQPAGTLYSTALGGGKDLIVDDEPDIRFMMPVREFESRQLRHDICRSPICGTGGTIW